MTVSLVTPGLVICTHPGKFHADDVFAVAFLKWAGLHPLHEIVRSSDPADLARADIVLDVGGVYDPETDRYDHHQRSFDRKREDGTPYASFGLIVDHFGRGHMSEEVFEAFDKNFVRLIDGPDCGHKMFEGDAIVIARLIEDFMPSWDENPDDKAMYRTFMEAVRWAEGIIYRTLKRTRSRIKAKEEIAKVISYHDKYRIVELTKFLPWQEYVCSNYEDALLCLFPNIRGGYAVQVVPVSPYSYESYIRPPQEWYGLQNGALQEVCGVPDATFCHANGFICAAATREGAMAMAKEIYMSGPELDPDISAEPGLPGADPIVDPPPGSPEEEVSHQMTVTMPTPLPTMFIGNPPVPVPAEATPGSEEPGVLATSPVVRNEGKKNASPYSLAERITNLVYDPEFIEVLDNPTAELRLMMAACLPHQDATPEEIKRVVRFVLENPDALCVYDYPPRRIPVPESDFS